jgi:deoxyribose-phosphate aldolase
MSSDDLIQTIVKQVVERLQAGGQAPATPAAAPAAPAPGVRSAHRVLVVLTAGDANLAELYRQLGLLTDQAAGLDLYLSPSARKVLDVPSVRRACPTANLLPAEVSHDLRALVEACDAVVLPSLTLSCASKIAHLDGDSVASLVPIYALYRGKAVVAARDSVYGLRADLPAAPPLFRRRVAQLLEDLAGLGVVLTDLAGLAAAVAAPRPAAPPPGASTADGATRLCSGGDPAVCAACGLCAQLNAPAVKDLVTSGAARIAAASGTKVSERSLAAYIDHTLLKAEATEAEVKKLCAEAREHSFASVCVNPTNVALAAKLLQGSKVAVCTVIGFPLGATTPTAKSIETRDAIANGATEIDMVMNVGALKSGNDDLVRRDIQAVVDAARGKAIVKVILETALLSKEEKVKACLLAKMAGADFVKTSTGFSSGGATVEDIALMRQTVGPEMGVKASGGIRDTATAQAMVAAGATRIGASASVAITKGEKAAAGTY